MMKKKSSKLDKPALLIFLILAILVNVPAVFAQDSSLRPYKGKQILVLIGPHYGLPMLEAITPAIVNTLTENGFGLDDVFVEFLDLHRHEAPQHRSNILAFLENKLKNRPIGLIVAVNQGAVDFVAREGKNLLPGVPILIPILERLPEWEGEPRKLITLTSRQDAEGTLGYALTLFPKTKQVLLIMGKDDHEAPFLAPILKALDDLPMNLHIETTADLPYEKMLEHVATLPRDAIAFYGSYFRDIAGRSFVPAEVAGRVAETANRPVFAFRDMHIVQGLAGGSVTITSELGKLAALIGLDYLAGNLRLVQPITAFEVPNAPLFDWRQLKRWGGDVGSLPAGTVFLNRPPTLWSQHKEAMIIALASFILLSFLVVALLVANGRQRAAIRKREQAEKSLMESEARYRCVFEAANVGKSVTLPTGEIDVNRAFSDMLGYGPEELRGKTWQELTPDEEIGPINELLAPLMRGERDAVRFEKRYIHKNGSYVLADVSATLQRDRDGNPLHFIVTVVDISVRKRTEEKLADEAGRRRLLLEQSRDGIVVLDQDGQVVESNRKFAEMLGYPHESMRQLNVGDWDFLHPPERLIEMLRSVDEKGDHFETRHRRRDGSTYDVEISSNAAWFAGQKLVLCICRDITDRKQTEEKMAEQLHELQRWHDVMLDREDRVIELKREVNELLAVGGQPTRYPSAVGGDKG